MNRILSILLLAVLMISCGGDKKGSNKDIWLFHLGETRSEVMASLDEKHMPYSEDTADGLSGITGHGFEIEYAGMDWNSFTTFLEKDLVVCIWLMRDNISTESFNNNTVGYRVESVIRDMNDKFGEHLTYLPKTDDSSGFTKYTWETDKVYAELSSMFDGKMVTLIVCDIQYKDKFKSKNPGEIETL